MGLTIISKKPCDYCKGDGKVADRDKLKKRLVVRVCPVCDGDPEGAPTIQGDIFKLIRKGKVKK